MRPEIINKLLWQKVFKISKITFQNILSSIFHWRGERERDFLSFNCIVVRIKHEFPFCFQREIGKLDRSNLSKSLNWVSITDNCCKVHPPEQEERNKVGIKYSKNCESCPTQVTWKTSTVPFLWNFLFNLELLHKIVF